MSRLRRIMLILAVVTIVSAIVDWRGQESVLLIGLVFGIIRIDGLEREVRRLKGKS